jgi:hypothetical protein
MCVLHRRCEAEALKGDALGISKKWEKQRNRILAVGMSAGEDRRMEELKSHDDNGGLGET